MALSACQLAYNPMMPQTQAPVPVPSNTLKLPTLRPLISQLMAKKQRTSVQVPAPTVDSQTIRVTTAKNDSCHLLQTVDSQSIGVGSGAFDFVKCASESQQNRMQIRPDHQ